MGYTGVTTHYGDDPPSMVDDFGFGGFNLVPYPILAGHEARKSTHLFLPTLPKRPLTNFYGFDIFLRPRTLWTSSGRRHMAWSSNNSLGRHLGGWRVTRLSKKNQQQSTLEPQQPMKHAGFKILNPQYMGEITPKNEGNVGSHGRWYFPVDIQAKYPPEVNGVWMVSFWGLNNYRTSGGGIGCL